MRIALLSDIHANLAALEAVARDHDATLAECDAVVTHARWHGLSSAIVCEHGRGLEPALRHVDAQIAVAMVNPGEERRFLLHGFVPTPRTIRFIGKRLTGDAPPLPKRRDAWYFTLGDLDFF